MALLKLLTTLTLLWVVIETKEVLSLDDVTAVVGEKFVYQIGNEDFLSTYKIHRIVQRGKKKLPEWLTFDTNSSLLIGYPKTDNVGMYTLRLRAQCINPAEMSCQDRISRTFHVHVNEPLKSAESRGRHTFSKHDNNGEWIYTNTINGNKRLYMEYDITRHGTVLEKTSGMLVSSSMHVPSTSLSYSAMQYGDIANYLRDKNVHDKLSSNYVLAMKYNTYTNYLPEMDIQDKNSDLPPQVQYVTKTFIGSIHNSDTHVASQFSFILYSSGINSVHYSDFFDKFSANALTAFAFSGDKNAAATQVYGYSDMYSSIFSRAGTFGNHEEYKPEKNLDDSPVLRHKSRNHHFSEGIKHEKSKQKFCHSDDEIVFYASLILHVAYNLTDAQKSLMIKKWSDFISKDQNLIFLSRTEAAGLQYDGKYILTAGPGNVIESLRRSVTVSWHLACGFFEQVHDFTRVLQHNIDAGRVSEELGFDVIAWYVYTDRLLPKRVKRQANMGRRRTGTPTISPPVPTTLSDEFTSMTSTLLPSVSVTSLSFSVTTYFSTVFFPSFKSASESSGLTSGATIMSFSSINDSALSTATGSVTFSSSDFLFKSTGLSLVMSSSDLTTKSPVKSTARATIFETFSYSMNFSGSVITSIDYSTPTLSSSVSLLPSFSESEFMSLSISSGIPSISSFFLSSEHSDVISKMMSTSVLNYMTSSDSVFSTVSSSVLISPDNSTQSAFFSDITTFPTSVISFVTISKSTVRTDNQSLFNPSSTPVLETSFVQSLSSMSRTSFSSEGILSMSRTLIPSSFSSLSLSSTQETFVFRSSVQIASHLISTLFSVPKSVDPLSKSVSFLESLYTPLSSLPSFYGTFLSEVKSEISSTTDKFSELSSFQNVESATLSSSLSILSFSSSDSILFSSIDSIESLTNIFTFSVSEVTASSENQSVLSMSVSSSHGSIFTPVSLSTSTFLVPDITTYSPLSVTSKAMTTSQSKTSLFSLTAISTDSVKAVSSIIVSSVFSSEETARFNFSDLLSSSRSEFSHQNFSSYDLTSEPTAAISYSSTTDIVPSFFSTSSTLRESVGTSVFSSFTMVYTAVSSVPLESPVTLTIAEESSMYYSSVISISPTRAFTITSVTKELPVDSTAVVTTAAPDESPSLKKSIDHLEMIIGRYYEFQIPEDTFSDNEDGNTRNLSLRISLTYSKPFPKDAWLMFNETSQSLFGIPLKSDLKGDKLISEFTLIAKDSEGQVAKDAITITYKYETNVNHRISVKLNGTYEKFVADRRNLIQFASLLADFYEDKTLKFLSFSEIEEGSVIVVWSNNSLFGENCMKSKIEDLYNRVNDENGTVSDQFQALFTDFPFISTKLEYFRACLLPVTSVAPPTKAPVSETDNKMWIEIVLPALIAILVIVIIALLLLICCRHRRPKKDVKDSDKPAFLEDRRPIIFPEELEMVDPSLKSKTPLVLPSDYLTETPPAVPSHGQAAPPYCTPMLDDGTFPGEDEDAPPPPPHRGQSQQSEPPPYRLPPPYYNPHRMT